MNSFIPWIGGKKLLRKEVIKRFPNDDGFTKYVEVFGGAGWVLFDKDQSKKQLEVFNDIDSNLINTGVLSFMLMQYKKNLTGSYHPGRYL